MRFLLIVIALWFSGKLIAQERSEVIQQRIEFIAEQSENEQLDLTNIFEQLNYFYDNPINLNNADPDALRALGLLTEVQISDLLLHVKRFGKLISIYELQSLTYWDLGTIQMVLPFVRVDDRLDQLHITFKEAMKNGKFEWYARYQRTLEFKQGYTPVSDSVLATSNSYYHGNADHYYSRFRYTYRTNISIGVTGDKDPGEQFFKGAQKQGFDFYSAHAFYKGGKYLQAAAVGDYLVQIGQGLNVWTGYAFGKTADIFSSKRSANLLRPYTSVDENRYFRGGAVVAGLGKFSWLNFYSQKRIDGTISVDSTVNTLDFVSAVAMTGFHRTTSEIEKKNRFNERVFGSYLTYRTARFNAGIAAVNQSYSSPIAKDSVPYNCYAFRGTQTSALSTDYNWVFKNFNFFGEVSYSTHSKAFAQLYGLMAMIDPRVSISLIYRDYNKAYYSFYNNGFSEGTNTQNERGLFLGTKIKLANAWTLNAYADYFKFPWLKYQVDAPSDGYEFLLQPVYKPNKEFELYARFRQQVRAKNSRNTDGTITEIEDVTQRNYRLNMSYKVSEAVQLKSRVEYMTIHRASNTPESGWIMTQDIVFRPKSSAFDVSLRYALFQTDSYDSRLYTFENNALYVFSIPAYYYQGSRAYVLLRYSFLRHCDIWIKYGRFLYADRSTIGSGAEEIKGNSKSDLTVQFRMSF